MTTSRQFLFILLTLSLCACASNPTPMRLSTNTPAEEDTAPVELPDQVATALILGGARAQVGDLEGALSYYRFAHEQLPRDVHIAIRYADTALRKGHPREALQALNRAARGRAIEPQLETRRIGIHLGLGDSAKAIELADAAVASDPTSMEFLDLLALSLEHAGDSARLPEVYEKLAELRPGDRALNARLARLAFEAGDLAEARERIEILLREDAEDHELLVLHGEILSAQEKFPEGLPFLRELIELQPGAIAPRTQIADRLLQQGDADGAVAVLLPVAQGGELSWGPRMLLADLLFRLDRVEESQSLVDELLREGHEAALLFRLAGELAQRGDDLETSERWLRRAVKADDQDLEAHVALLLVLSQRNPEVFQQATDRPSEVTNSFNRLLTRTSGLATGESFRYDYLLGTLLRRTSRFGEAITRLERASASQPDSEDALYDLAICQEELGRYEEARATLERLVELRPREANYLNFFGYLLAEQGWELERAESMILTALEAEPENPFYLDSLGWVYYQSGRFEEAYDTLILAMEGLGEDPVILEHVGDTLRALGQEVEALDMYRRALERGGEEARLRPRVNELEESLRESP